MLEEIPFPSKSFFLKPSNAKDLMFYNNLNEASEYHNSTLPPMSPNHICSLPCYLLLTPRMPLRDRWATHKGNETFTLWLPTEFLLYGFSYLKFEHKIVLEAVQEFLKE